MKVIKVLTMALFIGLTSQSIYAGGADTAMHVAIKDVISQASSLLEKAPKIKSTDPSFPFQAEFIELAVGQKEAAERVLFHVDSNGNVVCYPEMTGDLEEIKTATARLREIQDSLPQTHTTVGWLASKIIGVKKVQTIGEKLGLCYRRGIAAPSA